MDRLFLPGNMYVSLTHTIPSRRLALTLDELGLEDADMDAAIVAGTAVTVAPPGMTGRRLLWTIWAVGLRPVPG